MSYAEDMGYDSYYGDSEDLDMVDEDEVEELKEKVRQLQEKLDDIEMTLVEVFTSDDVDKKIKDFAYEIYKIVK